MSDEKPARLKPGPKPRRKKPGVKKGKYNANGEHVDGIWFASKSEALRYRQLRTLQELGAIDRLELQPAFPIYINNQLICTYKGDFSYVEISASGDPIETHIEDVKGFITPVYALKRKMVEAQYGIRIVEVPAGRATDKWALCLPHRAPNEKDYQPVKWERG